MNRIAVLVVRVALLLERCWIAVFITWMIAASFHLSGVSIPWEIIGFIGFYMVIGFMSSLMLALMRIRKIDPSVWVAYQLKKEK